MVVVIAQIDPAVEYFYETWMVVLWKNSAKRGMRWKDFYSHLSLFFPFSLLTALTISPSILSSPMAPANISIYAEWIRLDESEAMTNGVDDSPGPFSYVSLFLVPRLFLSLILLVGYPPFSFFPENWRLSIFLHSSLGCAFCFLFPSTFFIIHSFMPETQYFYRMAKIWFSSIWFRVKLLYPC